MPDPAIRRPRPKQIRPGREGHPVLLGRARPLPAPFGAGQAATLAEYRQACWPYFSWAPAPGAAAEGQ
jgi:hypothetical protein